MGGARPLLHDLRARVVVRLGAERFLRGPLHLLQDRRAGGHGVAAAAGKPVIALQWWHHSTVLLYCWHSYSVRIATGAWFACMNYSVHSVMYGYFAVMGTQYRKAVSRYAIYITLLQLVQMLVGMFVTIKAVMYQAAGEECHVNKTNSVLGLSMYASYFLLFFKLFMDNYFLKPKSEKVVRRKLMKDVAKAMSRRMTQTVHDEADADGEVEPAQVGKEGAAKKLN